MTTTTADTMQVDSTVALEKKRLRAYKIFLYATIVNNALLAIHTLGFAGGSTFAKVAAPAWAAPTLGFFGVATIVSALLALRWNKWGVIGVGVCGAAAVALALGIKLLLAAGLFAVGTTFWILIARHQWARLR